MAGQQILHHWRRPAIRHELELRPGAFLKIGSNDVGAAAHPADTDSRPAGIFLQPGDELLQVSRRQARSSDQPHWTICNECNRREVVYYIERQRIGGTVDDMGLPMSEDKCVAMRM